MKWIVTRTAAFLLSWATLVSAQPPPQLLWMGPQPPPGAGSKMLRRGPQSSTTIFGVPGYSWRHGCAPTAVGMVIGYYDMYGFPNLIPGDSSTQTSSVNQAIASQGSGIRGSGTQLHFEDYSLPLDEGQTEVIPDSSENYPTDCHLDNCVADFMHTSWSRFHSVYGSTWTSSVGPAFVSYVNLVNGAYNPSYAEYYFGSSLWSALTNEIDHNRPMTFAVDCDGDGKTDHMVAVVGYTDTPDQQYGCLDTWYAPSQIRWCQFREVSSSYPWGVSEGWLYALTPAADFDGDRDVDSLDSFMLQNCFSGPGVPFPQGCSDQDLDADGDVDQTDFGLLQQQLGMGVPVPPPGMVRIHAGEFLMGNSFDASEGYWGELPRHAVYIDTFYMDRTEVTNQQYADALNWAWSQGGLITVTGGVVYGSGTSCAYCDTSTSSSNNRITWDGATFGVLSGKESHPMVCVSWYGAAAYASWRSGMQGRPLGYDLATWNCNWNSGYRLPTEAEWEMAARGGVAGRRFPWADTDTIQHARANYYSDARYSYDTSPTRGYHPTFNTGGYPYTSYTSPVAYFAANEYGLYDMAGNVWEWCNDWYDSAYYSSSPYSNPHGPTTSGTYRVARGGSWLITPLYLRCAYRTYTIPNGRGIGHGFRLALNGP